VGARELIDATVSIGMISPRHRRALRLLFACLVSIGMGQSMLFSILPPTARELGLSPFQISTIFATSASFWVVVSPWWGRQSDVWGRRPVLLIGLLGYALSMALLATTITLGRDGWLRAPFVYPLMVVSRCIFALLGSGTGPAAQAYVADRTTITERAAGVALLSAAMGLGETIGPGVGAALATYGLTLPIYLAAVLAVASAVTIWLRLPEKRRPPSQESARRPRLSATDRRIVPFLIVGAALQAVRATTVITLSLFLQDTLGLTLKETAQRAGIGFVVLAVAGLFSQLVLVQRLRPSCRHMLWFGIPLMFLAFALLSVGRGFAVVLGALAMLGVGLGLVRPGSAAAASVSVEPEEQGGVAGLFGGVTTLGNVFGPMLGTTLYQLTPSAPYVLNATVMGAVLLFVLKSARVRQLRV
jgi:MFS family permease